MHSHKEIVCFHIEESDCVRGWHGRCAACVERLETWHEQVGGM